MRKTSQDGGDSTSITSGLGIMKSTRNSIKRKVQNLSHESDDGVIEPLLQKDKENSITGAKFSLSKTKTDQMSDRGKDNQAFKVVLPDTNPPASETNILNDTKLYDAPTTSSDIYKNVYSSIGTHRSYIPTTLETVKEQVLVSIDGSVIAERANSPLIFTTAKIHADPIPTAGNVSSNTDFNKAIQSSAALANNAESSKGSIINTLQDLQKTRPVLVDQSANNKCTMQSFETSFNVTLETKKFDVNLTNGKALPAVTKVDIKPASTNNLQTVKGKPTIILDSNVSNSKLEHIHVQVNTKCVGLENVSQEQNKSEITNEQNAFEKDAQVTCASHNVSLKTFASNNDSIKAVPGTIAKAAQEKKIDLSLSNTRPKAAIGKNDAFNAKLTDGKTTITETDKTKDMTKLTSIDKTSFDNKLSKSNTVSKSIKSKDATDTKTKQASTTRSSTRTINVSSVSKTSSSSAAKPVVSNSETNSATASSHSPTSSVSNPPKVSTTQTMRSASQSGSQSKFIKNSSNNSIESKAKVEKADEQDRNITTSKT